MVVDDNVLGEELVPCSTDPMTGAQRDGYCKHLRRDPGRHEVCAVMTDSFLAFTAARGNELRESRPELNFPGLEPGDHWCVCLPRWLEAEAAGEAPPVVLESTNHAVLEEVDLETLRDYAYEENEAGDSA